MNQEIGQGTTFVERNEAVREEARARWISAGDLKGWY